MLRQLRVKFVCINMVFLMGMLCIILGLVLHFTRLSLEQESLRMLQGAAERPAGPAEPGRPPEEVYLPCFTVRPNPQGGLSAQGGSRYDLTDQAFLQELVQAALASGGASGVLEGYALRFYLTPRCAVFTDISSERATLEQLAKTCAFGGCLGFLAFLLVSVLLAHWAVRPVERAWAQQRQFVADASHELKTPLTVIITNGELLQAPGRAAARQQYAQNILVMARQMQGLVVSLLELARVDSGAAGMAFARLDFSRLVSDALLPFEAVFYEQGLLLAEEVEAGVFLDGSPARLNQVLDILLDNAQKYSAPGGTVTVGLARKGRRRCLLSVSNPGAAIPPGELDRIFLRFTRLDQARSMNHSYGLGLSIAREIVLAHGGKIWAESGGGANTFWVELPAAPQQKPPPPTA